MKDKTNQPEDKLREDPLNDEIFRYLNCYEVSASEVSNGMTYIDSYEAQKMADALTHLHQQAMAEAVRAATLKELEVLTDSQDNSQDWERAHPGFSCEMIPADVVYDRIKALKQDTKNEGHV